MSQRHDDELTDKSGEAGRPPAAPRRTVRVPKRLFDAAPGEDVWVSVWENRAGRIRCRRSVADPYGCSVSRFTVGEADPDEETVEVDLEERFPLALWPEDL